MVHEKKKTQLIQAYHVTITNAHKFHIVQCILPAKNEAETINRLLSLDLCLKQHSYIKTPLLVNSKWTQHDAMFGNGQAFMTCTITTSRAYHFMWFCFLFFYLCFVFWGVLQLIADTFYCFHPFLSKIVQNSRNNMVLKSTAQQQFKSQTLQRMQPQNAT